ncbi:dCTPase [Aeromonas phage Asfd_1]|nr:dCTPase [Aeromonas phage Asfd_1]
MTPQFNECAQLSAGFDVADSCLEQLIAAGRNPLNTMYFMQQDLQIALHKKFPETNVNPLELKTCGEILQWLKNQDDYIADETRELYTALGGMSNPKPNAVWKPWRAEFAEYQARLFSDLSPADQLEAKFELVDQFHFFLNKMIAMGIDGDEMFRLYYVKNAENFERQKRGY